MFRGICTPSCKFTVSATISLCCLLSQILRFGYMLRERYPPRGTLCCDSSYYDRILQYKAGVRIPVNKWLVQSTHDIYVYRHSGAQGHKHTHKHTHPECRQMGSAAFDISDHRSVAATLSPQPLSMPSPVAKSTSKVPKILVTGQGHATAICILRARLERKGFKVRHVYAYACTWSITLISHMCDLFV